MVLKLYKIILLKCCKLKLQPCLLFILQSKPRVGELQAYPKSNLADSSTLSKQHTSATPDLLPHLNSADPVWSDWVACVFPRSGILNFWLPLLGSWNNSPLSPLQGKGLPACYPALMFSAFLGWDIENSCSLIPQLSCFSGEIIWQRSPRIFVLKKWFLIWK